MLRQSRLNKQRCVTGVDAGRKPIDDHIPHRFTDDRRIFVVRGERMPIRNEEKALVLVLQTHPILQHTVIVPRVHFVSRSHTGQHPLMLLGHCGKLSSRCQFMKSVLPR